MSDLQLRSDDLQLESLIALAQAGDAPAFAKLVDQHEVSLGRFLARLGFAHAEVKDLSQDTWLRVHTHLHSYTLKGSARFSTWLFTIARNLAFNENARRRRWGLTAEVSPVDADAPSNEALMIACEEKRLLDCAMRELEPEFRDTLALSYFEDLSLQEIAEIEGCAVGTVKSRLFRAKQKLLMILREGEGK